VDALDVPRSAEDKPLILTVGDNGSFELFDEDGGPQGRRGHPRHRRQVLHLRLQPGRPARHPLRAGAPLHRIRRRALRKNFAVKERGKKSGILETSLTGPDQEKIGLVLDDILKTYVRQNVERRSAEAENTLKFLETQLPALKREMDVAEAAYNNYRQAAAAST
jgi:tyrosine-protein kinase Etk/Wzc